MLNMFREPMSIESYESLGEEVWGYMVNQVLLLLHFKNGKVKSFRNYQNILRIGNIQISSFKI